MYINVYDMYMYILYICICFEYMIINEIYVYIIYIIDYIYISHFKNIYFQLILYIFQYIYIVRPRAPPQTNKARESELHYYTRQAKNVKVPVFRSIFWLHERFHGQALSRMKRPKLDEPLAV